MVIKNLCILVLWTKVASASEGLKRTSKTYLSRGVSAVQRKKMVHGTERGAPGVHHDTEYVEVMSKSAGRKKQHTAGVELHGCQRLVGVSREVCYDPLPLRVLLNIHLET